MPCFLSDQRSNALFDLTLISVTEPKIRFKLQSGVLAEVKYLNNSQIDYGFQHLLAGAYLIALMHHCACSHLHVDHLCPGVLSYQNK